MLDLLRRVEGRGAIETAHRIKGRCSNIFCYAVATGRAAGDPTGALKNALRPVVRTHMAAATTPEAVGGILKMIYGYHGSPIVIAALKLAPLVFVRPGELRQAEWKDFDLGAAEWRFQVSKTRNRGVSEHIVPLSSQALAILQDLQPLTGEGCYVFPSGTSAERPMSNNAVLAALRRMGVGTDEMTGHGWRATARTLIEEKLGYAPHIIEQQLAHIVRDPLGRAYNRTTHMKERKIMMQDWADYLDKLRDL
jgi:integrase